MESSPKFGPPPADGSARRRGQGVNLSFTFALPVAPLSRHSRGMRGRKAWQPARSLRDEFGTRRLHRALAGMALRVVALVGLCLLGSQFLIG